MQNSKAKERERRRNAGFVLRQVWVHEKDRDEFDEYVQCLPHNDLYKPPRRVRKKEPPQMPGLNDGTSV